jgi:hypothetical protein
MNQENNIAKAINKIKQSLDYYNQSQDYYVLRNKEVIDIIYKNKNELDWTYSPAGHFKTIYSIDDDTGKAKLTIVSEKEFDQRARINRLYSDQYMITDCSIFISLKTNKIKNKWINNEYVYVGMTYRVNSSLIDKSFSIHRLVAHAFCPRPEHLKDVPYDELQVNHIDGNKQNNHYTNLEWCTSSENHKHGHRTGLHANGADHVNSKITKDDVIWIRKHYSENPKTPYRFYMIKYSMNKESIRRIIHNERHYDPLYVPPRKLTMYEVSNGPRKKSII